MKVIYLSVAIAHADIFNGNYVSPNLNGVPFSVKTVEKISMSAMLIDKPSLLALELKRNERERKWCRKKTYKVQRPRLKIFVFK